MKLYYLLKKYITQIDIQLSKSFMKFKWINIIFVLNYFIIYFNSLF